MPSRGFDIPKQLRSEQPTAFILGVGSVNSLSFLRSLGRKRIPIVAIGAKNSAAMRSRYRVSIDYPATEEDDSVLLSFLERVGDSLPREGVLIPTNDASVLFTSRYRSSLGRYFKFVLADQATLDTITNKALQYQHAASVGTPIPYTHYPRDLADVENLAGDVIYPCIVKPAYSYLWSRYRASVGMDGWHKLAQADTPEGLINTYKQMAESGVQLLVQEKIGGGDDQNYTLLTYLNRDSKPLAIFVKRKLRRFPSALVTEVS